MNAVVAARTRYVMATIFSPLTPCCYPCGYSAHLGTDFSQKHRRHGVKVQVVADPAGKLLWIPPALPGRTYDLTAARTHRIIRIWRGSAESAQ